MSYFLMLDFGKDLIFDRALFTDYSNILKAVSFSFQHKSCILIVNTIIFGQPLQKLL